MPVPTIPKIYHIVHIDRLPSIIADGCLWCDAEIAKRTAPGTTIGMDSIKQRRLKLPISSHTHLHVGDCVPFYFCPRSVMLYLIYKSNHPEMTYRGGQGPIVHLEADLHAAVAWTKKSRSRWAFTLSNAGANYFEDRGNLAHLNEIDWDAVKAKLWSVSSVKEHKQAEFLMENHFPWHLFGRIGVHSRAIYQQVVNALPANGHRPQVEVQPEWYY
jgi:hypothetical protein